MKLIAERPGFLTVELQRRIREKRQVFAHFFRGGIREDEHLRHAFGHQTCQPDESRGRHKAGASRITNKAHGISPGVRDGNDVILTREAADFDTHTVGAVGGGLGKKHSPLTSSATAPCCFL